MSDEVWEAILLKYIVPYRTMNLNPGHKPAFIGHKDGEPLLNKKFPDRLRRLSEVCPDINIDIYSHGLMLPKWAERGQDFFSFLSTLPNKCRYLMSYHPFNHDNSTNDYTKTTEYMRNALRNKPSNVEVIMVAHESKQSPMAKLNEWKQSWEPEISRGVLTVHTNASINPWTGRMEDIATCEYHGCPYADFGHMFFGVSGNVIACCMDLEEEIVFGNVLTHEPAEMVATLEAFYKEQERINRERTGLVHEVCRNCFGMGKRTDLIQVGGLA